MENLWNTFLDSWPWISTILIGVGGAYGVKVKKAITSVKDVIEEIGDTHQVYKDAMADHNISESEAIHLGQEMTEDMVKLRLAAKNVLALVPEKYHKHISITLNEK